jgi:hypothetical protein
MACLRQELYVGQDHFLYALEDAAAGKADNDYYRVGEDFAFAASVLCSDRVFFE